jgi:hypothetical protein
VSWLALGQIAAGLAWLAFELRAATNKRSGDTTSEMVWSLEARPYVGALLRPLLGVFLVSLVGHLLFGWWLLP